MNHITKKIGIIITIPILLIFILTAVLYLPAVQNKAKEIAVRYASKATGMNISIEKIRLSFPLDLTVSGVGVTNTSTDTLLAVEKLVVRIKMLPLIKQKIELDELTLQHTQLNSDTLIPNLKIKGYIGSLYVNAKNIDLKTEKATINKAVLQNSSLSLIMDSTSAPTDTTSAPVNWKISIDDATISDLSAKIKLPADSVPWISKIEKTSLIEAAIDLGASRYSSAHFELLNGAVDYEGLLSISDINIDIDSVFNEGITTHALLKQFSLKEARGWSITKTQGKLQMDSSQLWINDFQLFTPYSSVLFDAKGATHAIQQGGKGLLDVSFNASIGKEDLLPALTDSLQHIFKNNFPNHPLKLKAAVSGNMNRFN